VSQLIEQQAPIDAAIVSAMVESTPESWREILLSITRPANALSVGAFLHELSSPEGFSPVGPADSLFDATFCLDKLLRDHGGTLESAVYSAKYTDGNWTYSVKFHYANGQL